ncbi:hypothetical protein [Sulfitobacter sp. R18_1]|uniref:hypothetical protein n=1 Tax=Sulfitobacter sp. R18_1 TaxID=2821104 RepID=UPI001ADA70BE|nr:hypothetical protein [Sulfitobacter sp. R18_1]MBO9428157.1 hypothetical protein [Sulfitobacter sp. R18_1]
MSHIIHPHSKSVTDYLDTLKETKRLSRFGFSEWAKTISQMALEAQKDALKCIAASDEVVTSYSGLGGHWDAYGSKTDDWKKRAIILRQNSPHQGYIVALVEVHPTPTEEGGNLIQDAYERQMKEREGMDRFKAIMMSDNDELAGLKADPENFKDFVDCPVGKIKVGFCRSNTELSDTARKMLENEYCENMVVEARLNRHTEVFYAKHAEPYTIQSECSASPSDVTDILQVISDVVQASPYADLVDDQMDFVRNNGLETYIEYNADIIGFAVRSMMASDGLVTDHIQRKFRDLNYVSTNNEEDLDFLREMPGVLRKYGVIDKDAKFDCNDMRNKAYLKVDDAENPVVVFETDHGTYEVRYTAAKEKWPAMIDLYRVSPLDDYERNDTNFLRKSLDEIRQVGSLIEKDGRYEVGPGEGVNPIDGRAIRDLIDIFSSAHTVTVCLEEEAKLKEAPSGP